MRMQKMSQITTLVFAVVVLLASGCQSNGPPAIRGSFPLKEKWHFEASAEIITTPGVGDGMVLVKAGSAVYALDARTGTSLWKTYISSNTVAPTSPPLIGNGLVVTEDGGDITALDATTGNVKWKTRNTGCSEIDIVPAAFSQTMVYVVWYRCSVTAYDLSTGKIVWEARLPGGRSSAFLFSDDRWIYVVATNEVLQILDPMTGKVTKEIQGQIGLPATYQDGVIYGFRQDDEFVAFDTHSATIQWNTTGIAGASSPLVDMQRAIVSVKRKPLVAIDIKTGQFLWEAQVSSDTYQTPVALDGIVYARGIDTGKIVALLPENGTQLGYLDTGAKVIIPEHAILWRPVKTADLLIVPVGKTVYAYGK